jgi:radical SAM protein with 4Fe4S-binding SPASM domain
MRGGVSALLASIKLFLGNPLMRTVLKYAIKKTSCLYTEDFESHSIIYHALTKYTGTEIYCPIGVEFSIDLINIAIKLGVKILGGDDKDVVDALKDPAIRRGLESMLKSIALYGVTAPQKLFAPFMVVWNFTNMCNLRCLHCYQKADRPLPSELSLKEKLWIVEEFDDLGIAAIALSGGEPTLHPDYLAIVKAAARRGIYVATATNGWRFADLDELKKAVDAGLRYVEVSIDSAYMNRHDIFRGVEGSWIKAVKALENAVKVGLSHAMAVTITKYNINEVDDILNLAESIGVKRVIFFNFIPVGRGEDVVNIDLDPVEREHFMRHIYREMKRRKIEIYTTAPEYGRVVMQMSGGNEVAPTHFVARGDVVTTAIAEFIGGCGAGRIYVALQPDGVVTPCVFMPINVGNIRYMPFRDIWNKSDFLSNLRNRNLLKGFCKICPYKNICGGCRAKAYAYFKDPLESDPGCIYNLKQFINIKTLNIENNDLAIK